MTLGQRIKMLRTKAGLTQEDLAKMIGYNHKTSISKIEKDILDINQSTVVALAKALNTTPSIIMGWEEIPETKSSEPPARDPLERFNSLSPKQQELFKLLLELTPDQAEEVVRYARFLKSHHE